MANDHEIANVYMRLRKALGRAVFGIVPPTEIEDIVQETYVRACQAGKRDTNNEPRAFLFKIARNLALDYAKRAETRLTIRHAETLDEEAYRYATPLTNETLDQAVANEDFGEFCSAVRGLPIQQRRAFVMKKVYGYTQREIATHMQISEKTVERHIALAMEKCIDYLQENNDMVAIKAPRHLRESRITRKGGDS